MRAKPSSLDSVVMISINTLISCEGIEQAETAYRERIARYGLDEEPWVVDYIRRYRRYAKRKSPLDNYIDVKAAVRALAEAR